MNSKFLFLDSCHPNSCQGDRPGGSLAEEQDCMELSQLLCKLLANLYLPSCSHCPAEGQGPWGLPDQGQSFIPRSLWAGPQGGYAPTQCPALERYRKPKPEGGGIGVGRRCRCRNTGVGWGGTTWRGEAEKHSCCSGKNTIRGEAGSLESGKALLSYPPSQGTPWNSWSAISSLRLAPKG